MWPISSHRAFCKWVVGFKKGFLCIVCCPSVSKLRNSRIVEYWNSIEYCTVNWDWLLVYRLFYSHKKRWVLTFSTPHRATYYVLLDSVLLGPFIALIVTREYWLMSQSLPQSVLQVKLSFGAALLFLVLHLWFMLDSLALICPLTHPWTSQSHKVLPQWIFRQYKFEFDCSWLTRCLGAFSYFHTLLRLGLSICLNSRTYACSFMESSEFVVTLSSATAESQNGHLRQANCRACASHNNFLEI